MWLPASYVACCTLEGRTPQAPFVDYPAMISKQGVEEACGTNQLEFPLHYCDWMVRTIGQDYICVTGTNLDLTDNSAD